MSNVSERKNREFLRLTAGCWRSRFTFSLALLAWVSAAATGCSVKRTVKVNVPPAILHARSATFEEMREIILNYDKIYALSSNNLRITFTSGRRESGELQKYASAPGYILLQRPNSTRLVVQYPVTKTTILDLLSVGDDFCVWVPRENKYYTGKNSAKELVVEDLPDSPGFTLRATHIFEAIIPQVNAEGSQGMFFEFSEQVDAEAKYYIFSVLKPGPGQRLHAAKKIWIERSKLTIARQQVYQEGGQIVSDIFYSNVTQVSGIYLPLRMRIDRPLDGYSLDIEFKGWRVNPELPESSFVLPPPPEAQIVPFKEKGRSTLS